jgi:L-glutamine-phosphate cytidylyltransferase
MKVIILAAGVGSRLKHLTKNKPKCLVELNNKPILDYQLNILRKQKIDNIIIVGGHYGYKLKRPNIILKINERYENTNMLYSLFIAEDYLDEDVIISYGDIVYSNEILQKLIENKSDISVVIDKDWKKYWRARNENPLDDAETLKLDNIGNITEIGMKPKNLDNIQGQYIGLMKFSKKGIKQLRKVVGNYKKNTLKFEKAFMTDILQVMISKGYKLNSVPIYGDWIEIDTVEDYKNPITIKRLNKII